MSEFFDSYQMTSATIDKIKNCALCSDRFLKTKTAHRPRPVVHAQHHAPILIAGQAPGARVHESGLPFTDRSGDRLREWLGLSSEEFYRKDRIAILPMAFCFPGYDAKGSDLPPPKICADTWRKDLMQEFSGARLTLLIGSYAQKWHMNVNTNVTETVAAWRRTAPRVFPLPHPSWRNTAWIKKNPWFEDELLPVLRREVRKAFES